MAVRLIEGKVKVVHYNGGVLTDSGYRGDDFSEFGLSVEEVRKTILQRLRDAGLLRRGEGVVFTGKFTEEEVEWADPQYCPFCKTQLDTVGACPVCDQGAREDDI